MLNNLHGNRDALLPLTTINAQCTPHRDLGTVAVVYSVEIWHAENCELFCLCQLFKNTCLRVLQVLNKFIGVKQVEERFYGLLICGQAKPVFSLMLNYYPSIVARKMGHQIRRC